MSRPRDFVTGVGYIFRGFTFLVSRPNLWIWAIIPTIINLIILVAMFGVFSHYFSDLNGWLALHLGLDKIAAPETFWQHIASAMLWVLDLVLKIFIALLSIIMIVLLSYAISFIVAGPFNDALSERVEIHARGILPPPFSVRKFAADIFRIIKWEVVKAMFLISIPIALFVLSFIPAVGGPLYVAAAFVLGAWDLGFSFTDIPMARRVLPLRARLEFANRNFLALTGLGLGFLIPFFALVFQAPLVVAGTLLYLDRAEKI